MAASDPELRKARRQAREARAAGVKLTLAVRRAVILIDAEMAKPSTSERGSRIAKITNELELANDLARLEFGIFYRKPTGKSK